MTTERKCTLCQRPLADDEKRCPVCFPQAPRGRPPKSDAPPQQPTQSVPAQPNNYLKTLESLINEGAFEVAKAYLDFIKANQGAHK